MKKLTTFFVLAIIFAFIGCDYLDDPDDECGPAKDINTTIYYKEGSNLIDAAFFGVIDNKMEFIFTTADWVTEEGICSKQHMNATYTITFNEDYMDQFESLEMEGKIVVGMMEYPVIITERTPAIYDGEGNDIGLAGWGPYKESGVGYVWGNVKLRFKYSGNETADKNKLYQALAKVQLDIKCYAPKE